METFAYPTLHQCERAGSSTMRMTDLHEVADDAAADEQTFDLVSLLQLPAGRMTVSRVRWRLVPMDPEGGAVGSRVRPAGPAHGGKLGGTGGAWGMRCGQRPRGRAQPRSERACRPCASRLMHPLAGSQQSADTLSYASAHGRPHTTCISRSVPKHVPGRGRRVAACSARPPGALPLTKRPVCRAAAVKPLWLTGAAPLTERPACRAAASRPPC